LTLGVFLGELAVHSYRRFAAKEKISDETYKHLILTSALANGASAVGSSLGAGIGFFIGTLIFPAGGGAVGAMIGSFIAGYGASATVRHYMDKKNPGTIEITDTNVITDEEKKKSYYKACDYLEVDYNATKKHIISIARYLYKQNHPDKNMNKSQEIKDEFEKRFIEVHCSMGFIEAYRKEQGTWTD
jgi:hypothetical protein